MKALIKLTFCRNLLYKLSSKKYTPPKFKHKVFIEPNFNGKGKRKAEYVIKDCFGEGLNDFHELKAYPINLDLILYILDSLLVGLL